MRVTRANEYWGVPEPEPRRTASTPSQREIEEMLHGPRIYAGMLHYAEDDFLPGQTEDPSKTKQTRSLIDRTTPHLQRLERDLGNGEGGSSPTDGTPERWPATLPGDRLLDVGEDSADTGLTVLEKGLNQVKDKPLKPGPKAPPPAPKPKAPTKIDLALPKAPPKKAFRRFRTAAAPDVNDLQPSGGVLGSHDSEPHYDSSGQEWLVKHPRGGEHWPAPLDMATAQIQQESGLPTAEIHTVDYHGTPTAVHKMIPGARDAFPGHRYDHANMSDDDILTLQKHHALDWMIGNHDAHPGQFIRDPETGQLIGIDKGQAFKYFGADRLSPNYHPNARYGESEPIYNGMWRNFGNGKGHMFDPSQGELGAYIQGLQSIPDDHYREILRPYAEKAAMIGKLATGGGPGFPPPDTIVPNDTESFLDAAVARKNNLGSDFANLYNKAMARRQQIVGYRRRRAYA